MREVALYKLKSGENISDAAMELIGDRRLTNEIHVIDGVAYLRGEKAGPPARWAAAPPQQRSNTSSEPESE